MAKLAASVVATVLADLVSNYLQGMGGAGAERRVVIPGLTPRIAKDLQILLEQSDIPTYLVIPRDGGLVPDAGKRWLYAEALTSVRHGSMIVVVFPGEISRIHESMIGTGGAIRSPIFSDEWPWVDDGNEFFSYRDRFMGSLLDQWQVPGESRLAFRSLLTHLTFATGANVARAKMLLEDILGGFVSAHGTGTPPVLEQFMRHAQVLRPITVNPSNTVAVNKMWADLGGFCSAVAARCAEDGARIELSERAASLSPAHETAILEMLDGILGNSESTTRGVLSISSGLSGNVWDVLGEKELREIFDIRQATDTAELTVSIEGSPLSDTDSLSAVLLDNTILRVELRYDGLPTGEHMQYEVSLTQRKRALGGGPWQCQAESGIATLDVTMSTLFPRGNPRAAKIALRAVLTRAGKVLHNLPISIYPCFADAPLLLVMNPGFVVTHGVFSTQETVDEDSGAEPIDVEGEVALLVVTAGGEAGSLEIAGSPLPLVAAGTSNHVWESNSTIDASDFPGGTVNVVASSGEFEADIEIRSTFEGRGKTSVECEFIEQVASGPESRVKKLVGIFGGKVSEHYGWLGIDEGGMTRTRVARFWERDDVGGRPIVANFALADSAVPQVDGSLGVIGRASPRVAQCNLGSSADMVTAYEEARLKLLAEVRSAYAPDSRWPAHAYYPLYVEQRAGVLEPLVAAYIASYVRILNAFTNLEQSVTWDERFLLVYRDCIVHWADDGTDLGLVLMGPWHPLVVAKRFMVQRATLHAARRRLDKGTGGMFNSLVRLLAQTPGFHRVPGLSARDLSVVDMFAAPTDDPGWHVLMDSAWMQPDKVTAVARLIGVWGLGSAVFSGSLEEMAGRYIKGFSTAFPSRRAVTVHATSDYSASGLVDSARRAIYADDASLTPLGERLPGGVHLIVDDKSAKLDFDPAPWRTPPVCVYFSGMDGSRLKTHDISLTPPASASFAQRSGIIPPMPRGEASDAAFSAGLRMATQAASGAPTSALLLAESGPMIQVGAGAEFRNALHAIDSLLGPSGSLFWDFQLPQALKFTWTVIPGNQADPAALARYVRDGRRAGQSRALWDYRMSVTGAQQSYFVVSLVPDIVKAALNGSPILGGQPLAEDFLGELGELGISIGSDSVRSAKGAVGAIGVVAAVRLMERVRSSMSTVTRAHSRQILLPVDSFTDILTHPSAAIEGETLKRADLVAMRLTRPIGASRTEVRAVVLECKYLSSPMTEAYATAAAAQAKITYDRLRRLAEVARSANGIPERLAFVALVGFGLRLSATDQANEVALDAALLNDLMCGKFDFMPATADAMVVSTEVSLTTAEVRELTPRELWVRTGQGHWPGVVDSPELNSVQQRLNQLFSSESQTSPQPPAVSTVSTPSVDVGLPASLTGLEAQLPGHAAASAIVEQPAAPEVSVRPTDPYIEWRALIGCSESGLPVRLEPIANGVRLENRHLMITGSSGKGKTQLIKSLICQGRDAGARVLLLDFKNDFSDDIEFLAAARLECHHVRFDGIPYNPLIPVAIRHPRTGVPIVQCAQHMSGIRDVLEKTFSIGDAQAGDLKNVMLQAYSDYGVDPTADAPFDAAHRYPDFADVGRLLRVANASAYRRLDRLFELGIFQEGSREKSFESLISSSLVLDLSQLPSDAVRNAIARIIVLSAHAHYNAQPHTGGLRQLLVFDEAHRVLSSPDLARFVREARAYGVGIVLSSQNPWDFPVDIAASLATKIIHGNDRDRDRVRMLTNLLGDATAADAVSGLGLFEAFVSNAQYKCEKVRTFTYPHLLMYKFLVASGPVFPAEIPSIEGIDPHKLSPQEIINHLLLLGLARRGTAGIEAVARQVIE